VEILIEFNVHVNCVSMFSLVPLLMAVENGYLNVVTCLIEKGRADVNIRGVDDNSALHFAVINGYVEITKYLLDHGADKTAKNKSGKTPADIASKSILYLLTDGKEGEMADPHDASRMRDEEIYYYWDTLLSGRRDMRIPFECLEIKEIIGEGNFGNVYSATLNSSFSFPSDFGPPSSSSPSDSSVASSSDSSSSNLPIESLEKTKALPRDLAAKFLRYQLDCHYSRVFNLLISEEI
jgi:hypothetical protein